MEESEEVIIVHPWQGRKSHSFQKLNSKISFVHINGYPNVWAIELILAKAPNLKTIQVIPSMVEGIKSSYLKLCQERNVQIISGRRRPEYIWNKREYRPHFYHQYQSFFLNLRKEQKDIFDVLISLGFKEAVVTSRYLCLKGEDYLSQRIIAKQYRLCRGGEVSRMIRSLIHYFDPSFETGERPKRTARNIARRLSKIQLFLTPFVIAERLGISKLPDGLPRRRLGTYEAVLMASRDGRLAALKEKHARAHQVVCLRFGFENEVYWTLQEIADLMNFTNRERARQLENRGLKILGIISS